MEEDDNSLYYTLQSEIIKPEFEEIKHIIKMLLVKTI